MRMRARGYRAEHKDRRLEVLMRSREVVRKETVTFCALDMMATHS